MHVTFHGVRGSTPCHGDDISRYGGNTSCVAVRVPGEGPLFFDLGTGARYLGRTLPQDGTFRGTCLLSHLHWDHTQGLPFFTPLLREGAVLDVYAPEQDDGRTVAEVFDTTIRFAQAAAVDCRRDGRLAHEYEQAALAADPWWKHTSRGETFSRAATGLADDYQHLTNEILTALAGTEHTWRTA